MVKLRTTTKHVTHGTAKTILEMTSSQARAFLLKPESYCNLDLPHYIQFGPILDEVSRILGKTTLASVQRHSPRTEEGVNYAMLSNKDGRHAWRPFQLIHPALYVSLVDKITTQQNWEAIRSRFSRFNSRATIKCLSIPLSSASKRKDKAAQILNWWQGIEQASIELALDYMYVFHADLTDCYGSIYTHSIAWALHGRKKAKNERSNKSLIGNSIDAHIQDMRHGQTNGIPQGSVLMDVIAEMVLGYADLILGKRLAKAKINDYYILRYRDDYRIFVNNPQSGETILKTVTEVMIHLGLKLNAAKTTGSQSVVTSSLKADKRAWLRSKDRHQNLQKHLLLIHAHGVEHPNAGSLVVALSEFFRRLAKAKTFRNPVSLISIAVDIAYSSPRAFPICAAIVSKLLKGLKSDQHRIEIIRKIHRKLSQLPNTGHMEIWLQRISHPYEPSIKFNEPLCDLVRGKTVSIWNNDWISTNKLIAAVDPAQIVNQQELRDLIPVVQPDEIEVFAY